MEYTGRNLASPTKMTGHPYITVLRYCAVMLESGPMCSDVNKDLGLKAKAKAKDLGPKAKAKTRDIKVKFFTGLHRTPYIIFHR